MKHKFIHPVETRYRTEMAELFTEETKLEKWLRVEAALAIAHSKLGTIPIKEAEEINTKARINHVKLERVKEIDARIHHDLMAMVKALTEQCSGDAGKYVHLGATSYDIEDTALALILKDALLCVKARVIEFIIVLKNLMAENKDLVCIGRTHGQHAIPTTYGMRFGVWAYELHRHVERIEEIIKRISFGKMSGAVGTMASFGEKGSKLQELVMMELNLNPVLIANQVIQRDRHAEVILMTCLIGQTLAKFARENRILQRNEIAEMFESFIKNQVGSSTMPHKRNPHKSERICSLARILKSNAIVALDNMILEDERDLTNSASERVIFAENFIFLDFMLNQMIKIFKSIELNHKNIESNLSLTKGACMTEKIMVASVKKGIGRQEAHELLRKAAIQAREQNKYMKEILSANEIFKNKFTKKELNDLFDPHQYIGTAVSQVEKLISFLEMKYES